VLLQLFLWPSYHLLQKRNWHHLKLTSVIICIIVTQLEVGSMPGWSVGHGHSGIGPDIRWIAA
jgi:hypothetical protein